MLRGETIRMIMKTEWEEINGILYKRISKTLYIRDRKDWRFDFVNSRMNRKNNRIVFKDFEVRNDSIVILDVDTLERHVHGKNRTDWQYREWVELSIPELKWIDSTPLRWSK